MAITTEQLFDNTSNTSNIANAANLNVNFQGNDAEGLTGFGTAGWSSYNHQFTLSEGDVNGDEISDFIIGPSSGNSGPSYVVFGRDWSESFEDVNGDGIADFTFGPSVGAKYVAFGDGEILAPEVNGVVEENDDMPLGVFPSLHFATKNLPMVPITEFTLKQINDEDMVYVDNSAKQDSIPDNFVSNTIIGASVVGGLGVSFLLLKQYFTKKENEAKHLEIPAKQFSGAKQFLEKLPVQSSTAVQPSTTLITKASEQQPGAPLSITPLWAATKNGNTVASAPSSSSLSFQNQDKEDPQDNYQDKDMVFITHSDALSSSPRKV